MKTASSVLTRGKAPRPQLSAGWRPNFRFASPALAVDDASVDVVPDISMGEKYGSRILAAIAMLFMVLSVVFVGVWTILISTISATPQIDSNVLLVQRAAWVQGQADIGQVAFVVPEAATSAGSRIAEAFSGYQGGMVVEIAAQPGQSRSVGDNGNLIVDNFDLGVRAPEVIPGTLNDYLAVCISGQCPQGTIISVPVVDVVGKVSGVLGSDGFRDLTRAN